MPIYCKEVNGSIAFLDSRINVISKEAIQIDAGLWKQLLQDQANGMVLRFGENGPYAEPQTIQEVGIEEYRSKCKLQIISNMQKFISEKPDSTPRYDNMLMMAIMLFIYQHGVDEKPVSVAIEWINSIQMEFLRIDALITSAKTKEEINAAVAESSSSTLEVKYGVSGNVNPDPDLTILSLWNATEQAKAQK